MSGISEAANNLVRVYADAWIAHRRAEQELEEAKARELETLVAYQQAWRNCQHLYGLHLVGGQAVLVEPNRDYPHVAQIVSGANR